MTLCANDGWTSDWPMSQLLPSLDTLEMGSRTVREFVTHQAGLESWIPLLPQGLG